MSSLPSAAPGGANPLDWGALAPLRLKVRSVVHGMYAGPHRSIRTGSGVEFTGQRPYLPGDDLRFFDRRAFLRHERLMIREFETETDRAVWICLNATASMTFRSERAAGAKLAYAGLLAAALARVALSSGELVGIRWVGGHKVIPLCPIGGVGAFERIVSAIEGVVGGGDATSDRQAVLCALAPIAHKGRRRSAAVLFSDLVDLPSTACGDFLALAPRARALVVVRVLNPVERNLRMKGNVRLRALEGNAVVDTDADAVRQSYRERLTMIAASWSNAVTSRGGRFLDVTTTDDATLAARSIVLALNRAS